MDKAITFADLCRIIVHELALCTKSNTFKVQILAIGINEPTITTMCLLMQNYCVAIFRLHLKIISYIDTHKSSC